MNIEKFINSRNFILGKRINSYNNSLIRIGSSKLNSIIQTMDSIFYFIGNFTNCKCRIRSYTKFHLTTPFYYIIS